MKEKGRSRALHKKPYGLCKRFLAAMIAAVMVTTNIGTDLTTAYAAESSDSVTFEMSGSGLVTAIEEAIAAGNPLQKGDIDFTNGKTEQFEALFYGEGNIYEIYPEYDGGDMDAELRVFVRLPEDADDMYMVTGDEEIIFLYVNNGESSISCSTSITRMEDGKEKVKRTKKLTVKSYEAAFGDEEVNIISKPAETVPSETGPSETIPAETIPAETEPAETEPTETEPSEEIPTEAVPTEPDSSETTSSEANPAESEPAKPQNRPLRVRRHRHLQERKDRRKQLLHQQRVQTQADRIQKSLKRNQRDPGLRIQISPRKYPITQKKK